MNYIFVASFAFILTLLLTRLAIFVFPRWGLLDRPHLYGLKRAPIPYYGGVVLFISFVVSVLMFVPLTAQLIGFLLAATMIALLGFFDDLLRLSPLLRIFIQFLAAVVLVSAGIGILSIQIPFLGELDFTVVVWQGIAILSAIFTVVWVLTILNTMNFIDGVSGLNSGVTFIAASTLFALSVHPGLHENPASQAPVATMSLILAMVALAFLIFDFPRARILMGDSGSTFFGFLIAALAIFSGGKVATAFLVLGIPILDMVWVVLRRFFSGQKIWHGDMKHLHHRFLGLGLSDRRVVAIYLGITALLGLMSVVLISSQQKFFMLIALVLFMLILALGLVFGKKE